MNCDAKAWIMSPPSVRSSMDASFGLSNHPFTRALVFGVIRNLLHIDWILSRYCQPQLSALPRPIRNILRLGTFQIRKMDDVPPWSAVDESVKCAKKYGHKGTASLVNAVLRRVIKGGNDGIPDFQKDPVMHISLMTSHPFWMVERWTRRWGNERAFRLCISNNLYGRLPVVPNYHRIRSEELEKILRGNCINFHRGTYHRQTLYISDSAHFLRSEPFTGGCVLVQDEFQSLVTALAAPRREEVIVDLCAAPGGKSAAMYNSTGPGSTVIAVDNRLDRLEAMRENLDRLGYNGVRIVCADVRALPFSIEADKVILDVPCSGTGVLSKRPDIKWNRTDERVRGNTSMQLELLNAAATLIRRGGGLIYSTCSLEEEENEMVIRRFLDSHADFKPDDRYIDRIPSALRTECGMMLVPDDGISGGFATALEKV
jgi:16S rRNA (cytosine967-C5)-methyltransferase